jgi:osmotically-inducible protein OsmY
MANTRNRSQSRPQSRSQARSQSQRRGSSRNPSATNQTYPTDYWDYTDYYYEDVGNPQYAGYETQEMQSQDMDYASAPVWVIEEYWWAVPGPHTGKGPKGFERSDRDIQNEVSRRMAQNGQLDASGIDVNVNNCEVTLSGLVNSRQDKRLAEDIADSVFGVEDVHNQLRVNKQGQMGQTRQMGAGQMGRAAQSSNLHQGQKVVGSKGKEVGTVKEVHNSDFTVNRPMAADVRIPFSAIEATTDLEIRLNVPADQVDKQGWTRLTS